MMVRIIMMIGLLLVSTVAMAQTPSIKRAMDDIGQSLADDTPMMDRYVYDDAQTIDRNVALTLPVMPDQDVQLWLTDHVVQIMTVSPTVYPTHRAQIAALLTNTGLAQLDQQWSQAQIPQIVSQQGYNLTTLVTDPPRIVAKGRQQPDGKVYRWIADVPVLMSYARHAEPVQSFRLMLRIGLTRVPLRENGQLVAIDQWGVAPSNVAPATPPASSANGAAAL